MHRRRSTLALVTTLFASAGLVWITVGGRDGPPREPAAVAHPPDDTEEWRASLPPAGEGLACLAELARDDSLELERTPLAALEERSARTARLRVEDDGGAPVPSIRLSLAEGEASTSTSAVHQGTERASPDGVYRLALPHGGIWSYAVWADGYLEARIAGTLQVGDDASEVRLVFTRVGQILGLVVGSDGLGIAGAEVRVKGESTGVGTDRGGRFVLAGLRNGVCTVEASHEGRFARREVRVDARSELEELRIELPRNGRIEGRVVDAAGLPLPRPEIIVVTLEDQEAERRYEAKGDDAGRFVIEDVRPGRYLVASEVEDGLDEDSEDIFAGVLTANTVVESDRTSEVELRAARGSPVEVFGKVTVEGGNGGPGFLALRDRCRLGEGTHTVTTDGEGNYRVLLDGPGDWIFAFGGFLAERLSPVLVRVPRVARFHHDLALGGVEISGQVLDPRGKAVSGCTIEVVPDAGLATIGFPGESDPVVSEDLGSFEVQLLEEGGYTLYAIPDPESPGLGIGRAHVVARRDSRANTVVLQLSPALLLEGRTIDSEGRPVANASVQAFSHSGRALHPRSLARSDARGRFLLDRLPPEDAWIQACTEESASAEPLLLSAARSIASGASEVVKLVLSPAAWLVVDVEQRGGELLPSHVVVRDANGIDRAAVEAPGAAERILSAGWEFSQRRIGPLPAGSYQVEAHISDGRALERSILTDGRTETHLSIAFE